MYRDKPFLFIYDWGFQASESTKRQHKSIHTTYAYTFSACLDYFYGTFVSISL